MAEPIEYIYQIVRRLNRNRLMMRKRILNLRLSTMFLHLLVPGLGHIYAREYLFGIFVFLIMMVASVLFVAGLFMELPFIAKIGLYGLPSIFYLFAVFDLNNTVTKRQKNSHRKVPRVTIRKFAYYVIIGIIIQIVWPLAPLNFAIYNAPHIFVMENNDLAPVFKRGDLLKASSLSWRVHLSLLEKPIIYKIPDRFEIVQFTDKSKKDVCGYVIGLPTETIEVVDGTIIANNVPLLGVADGRIPIPGDLELTQVGNYNMLVATLRMGLIDDVYQVPLSSLIGKVDYLF